MRLETLALDPNWNSPEFSTDTRDNLGPLGWTHSSPPELTIGPGGSRTVDLGHVIDSAKHVYFTLLMPSAPLSGVQYLVPGSYRVSVAVVAHNVDASRYELDVTWDGQWTGDRPLSEHLTVTTPQRVE